MTFQKRTFTKSIKILSIYEIIEKYDQEYVNTNVALANIISTITILIKNLERSQTPSQFIGSNSIDLTLSVLKNINHYYDLQYGFPGKTCTMNYLISTKQKDHLHTFLEKNIISYRTYQEEFEAWKGKYQEKKYKQQN